MHVVFETGGKQYRVKPGDRISVELLPYEGEEVVFSKVLAVETDDDLKVGRPALENVQVVGKVLRRYKAPKVIVFKKKRRKQYRRWKGHRQNYLEVEILSVRGI